MDKKTLTSLFAEDIYQIPDYQRGYAWEEKQWKDFIQDADALVDENVASHYTGTVVVYKGDGSAMWNYGTQRLRVADVVDGQQRLTSACLYLSVIIHALVSKGESAYGNNIPNFLYSGAICKITLNNDSNNVFFDLLKTGRSNVEARSPHEKRLIAACNRFREHIDSQLVARGTGGVSYLKELYHAITQKLHFTFYAIEDECEIGMTFELMNSRGKGLSVLELLKNYLMHWVSRNEPDPVERNTLTTLINKNWKDTYTNLSSCAGDEDQCLRIAWTLYCSYTPANWNGYEGFKGDNYIPLRDFSPEYTKSDVKDFIGRFSHGLAEISKYYACMLTPTVKNTLSQDEFLWLTKIHHTGNIANFLPLMVAARKFRESESVAEVDYIALLRSLECFAYRVFLYNGRRSNAGKSRFYKWGSEIFTQKQTLQNVALLVHDLTRYYASEKSFAEGNAKPGNWYGTRNRLKYTLFEYELHLLATEGQGKSPALMWDQLSDSTIEHILPQTPEEESHWKATWTPDDFKECLHDIANLTLTQDNSSYRNFEFVRKKGQPGQSPSYSNSDIRQERKLAVHLDWTRKEFDQRKKELECWVNQRWKTEGDSSATPLEIIDEEDEDANFLAVNSIAPGEGFKKTQDELSSSETVYLEFWGKFKDFCLSQGTHLELRKPSSRHYYSFSVGRSDFSLGLTASRQKRRIGCEIYIKGKDAKSAFKLLEKERSNIEKNTGRLDWQELSEGQDCRIILARSETDISNPSSWPEAFQWLKAKAELFHSVFSSLIKSLPIKDGEGRE